MTTPEEVKTLFSDLADTYTVIVGQPTDDDVKRLRETITNLLQSIDVPGGVCNLSGLIDTDATYNAIHGHPFDPMLLPLAAYDPAIADDATDAVRTRAERNWSARLALRRLIRAAELHGRNFLLLVVEDTWLLSLKSDVTFYNMVSLRDMLDHLSTNMPGVEATDIITLSVEMQSYWQDDPRVPEYINKLEETQKKAVRSGLPITNDWLAATASLSLLTSGSFPKQRSDWDSLAPALKTWPAWKAWARTTQQTVEREQRATNARSDVFGTAGAAIEFHRTSPSDNAFAGGALSSTFEEQFASGMDALALAASNEKTVLDNLVATNKSLSDTTAKKIANIEALLSTLAAKSPSSGTPAPSTSSDSKQLAQLKAAIKGKWTSGGFCSSHGYGVNLEHDSKTCKNKKPGHVDTATRANPAGHGAEKHINQGWDAFLLTPK